MTDDLTIGEKIKVLRKTQRMSVVEFADLHGLNKDNLYKWEKGTKPSDPEDFLKLEKILQADNTGNVTTVQSNVSTNMEFIKKRRAAKIESNVFLVPYVDVKAQAGYTKAYSNIDYIVTLKHYPILPDVDPTGATWRYFQVEGNSMEGEIRDGDTILASLVIRDDWTNIRDFYTHVVVTDDNLVIKDILKESDASWILLSQNEAYEAKRVKVADVRQLWVMRRHVRNRVNKTRIYDLKEIKKQLK